MKTAGIIAEYNPFHNGHAFHIEKCRELTGCGNIIAVMSGDYVQRGGPAIIGKRERTHMALKNGVDIVIELPPAFSMSSAERFAYAAVYLLDAANVIESVCFGSEETSVTALEKAADVLLNETGEFKTVLSRRLKSGASYAEARYEAANATCGAITPLREPNSILAVEYIKALKRLNSPIAPYAAPRAGAAHDSGDISGVYASASAIRAALKSGDFETAERFTPPDCFEILAKTRAFIDIDDFSLLLHSSLITKTGRDLDDIFENAEGLNARVKTAARSRFYISEIAEAVKTRRFTYTRILRVIFNIILGVTKQFYAEYAGKPPYLRVLGFNGKKDALLGEIIKNASLPVVMNVKKDYEKLKRESPAAFRMLEFDIAASEIYAAARKSPKSEFEYELIIV